MNRRTRWMFGPVALVLFAAWPASAAEPVLSAPSVPVIRSATSEPVLMASPSLRLIVAREETLVVTRSGSGDPVVLVPGLFGLAYGYRQLVPLLVSAGFQTIVIEPLGIGYSSRPKGADYTLTAQADRLALAMSQLELPPAIVISHGVGTSMSLRLALRHPEHVRGIVSIDGGPAETAASPTLGSIMKFAPLLKALAGEGAVRGKVRSLFEKASGDRAWITDEVVRSYSVPLVADFGTAAAAFRSMAASAEPESLGPQLGRIAVPVDLLLGGAPHDHGVPPAELIIMRGGLRDFLSVAVPGSGHYIHEEQPAAVVIAVQRVVRRAG